MKSILLENYSGSGEVRINHLRSRSRTVGIMERQMRVVTRNMKLYRYDID